MASMQKVSLLEELEDKAGARWPFLVAAAVTATLLVLNAVAKVLA